MIQDSKTKKTVSTCSISSDSPEFLKRTIITLAILTLAGQLLIEALKATFTHSDKTLAEFKDELAEPDNAP